MIFFLVLIPTLLFAGCSRKSEKHWQGIRHEDSQQVGDAEASRGEHHSFVGVHQCCWFWILGHCSSIGEVFTENYEDWWIYPHSNQAFIDKCLKNMFQLELHELHVFLIDLFLTVWHSCWSPGSSIFMPHTSQAKTGPCCVCVCKRLDMGNNVEQQMYCRQYTVSM